MSEDLRPAQEQPIEMAPDSRLEALVLRLLVHHFPGEPDLDRTHLLVGVLPLDLPESLPIPSDARVLGSLVRGRKEVTVVLDTALPAEGALAFYRERLGAAGWTPADAGRQGGFSHGSATRNVAFCRSRHGPTLQVDAVSIAGATQVRLDLQVDEHYRCGAARHDLFSRIPRLTPPEGEQRAMGGSGGSESAFATAQLTTDLDLTAVAGHYRAQLIQAGWAQGEAGEAGPLAWSSYTFMDEEEASWRGSLFVFRQPGASKEYILQVWVEVALAAGAMDGGWAAWSSLVPAQ